MDRYIRALEPVASQVMLLMFVIAARLASALLRVNYASGSVLITSICMDWRKEQLISAARNIFALSTALSQEYARSRQLHIPSRLLSQEDMKRFNIRSTLKLPNGSNAPSPFHPGKQSMMVNTIIVLIGKLFISAKTDVRIVATSVHYRLVILSKSMRLATVPCLARGGLWTNLMTLPPSKSRVESFPPMTRVLP